MSQLKQQVGGDHYKKLIIQPLQLAYAVANGDACFCKIAKYISRGKHENDLEKAASVCKLSTELRPQETFHHYNQNPQAAETLVGSFAQQFPDKEEFIKQTLVEYLRGYPDDAIQQIEKQIREERNGRA